MNLLAKIGLPVAILAVASLGAVWLVQSKPQLQPSAPREQVWTVAVAEVRHETVQPSIRLYGEVVAGRAVELRALVAGEVVQVGDAMREGGLVGKDDLLIAIDDFEYRASLDERRAQLDEAKARLVEFRARERMHRQALAQDRAMVGLSERDVARAQKLSKLGTASEKSLDTAQMELTRQRQAASVRESELQAESARLAQQQAQITRAEVALRRAERDLENTRLTAPFAGVLSDVQTELGQRLSLNDRVARLVDTSRLEVSLTLSEAQFGRLSETGNSIVGRPAEVVWRHGNSVSVYQAVVDRVGARIESASGGVAVFVRIKDTDLNTPLRPGAFVEVSLPDRRYDNVVRLPESALFEGQTVYVVEDERLAARRVGLVARSGGTVLLQGDLKDGDRVVITRYAGIGPAQKVQVR